MAIAIGSVVAMAGNVGAQKYGLAAKRGATTASARTDLDIIAGLVRRVVGPLIVDTRSTQQGGDQPGRGHGARREVGRVDPSRAAPRVHRAHAHAVGGTARQTRARMGGRIGGNRERVAVRRTPGARAVFDFESARVSIISFCRPSLLKSNPWIRRPQRPELPTGYAWMNRSNNALPSLPYCTNKSVYPCLLRASRNCKSNT